MKAKLTKNIHPGTVLKKDFIDKNKITVYHVAKHTLLSQTRLSQIIKGERAVTPETDLKLSKFFQTKAGFWLNIQANYDLENTRKAIGKELDKIKPLK